MSLTVALVGNSNQAIYGAGDPGQTAYFYFSVTPDSATAGDFTFSYSGGLGRYMTCTFTPATLVISDSLTAFILAEVTAGVGGTTPAGNYYPSFAAAPAVGLAAITPSVTVTVD